MAIMSSLTVGQKLGPYEILAPLGEGGMGQVWKARDTRLNRVVAIKKSRDRFSERFEREAHAIAALNHPNICSLYDVGPDYLVMEYVEGKPLSGPMPVNEALVLAGQILDALDEAHRKGIVHRDLKPGNILLGKKGVKVLDFGLAKVEQGPSSSDSATQTMPLTSEGSILGTLQYMAPEQVEGKEADARSDIFAFGAVIYELITGKRPFSGASQAGLIASILKEHPRPLHEYQKLATPALERVLQTCLEKDPEKRWQSAREVKHALEWMTADSPAAAPAPVPAKRGWVWPSVAAALAIGLGVTAWVLWPKAAPARAARFEVQLPEEVTFSQYVSFSPDGRKLLFNAIGEQGGLWIRDVDALNWRRLPDTNGANSPFWSPDSKYVGFGFQSQLRKMDLASGTAQTLCESVSTVGTGAWNQDGVIVFGNRGSGPMHRVSQAGGTPVDVTVVDSDRGETFHALPTFLPDGKHFLYLRQGRPEVRGIYVGSLDLKPEQQSKDRLLATQYAAQYANGYLFFMRENSLMAQSFDTGKLQLQGDPIPVAEHVATTQAIGVFSVSPSGALAYRTGSTDADYQLTWFDRAGKNLSTFGQLGADQDVSLFPDGTRAAVRDNVGRSPGDLWILDFARGVRTRFTFRQQPGSAAVFSADGSRVIYTAGQTVETIYEKPSSGASEPKALYTMKGENLLPTSWSADGRYLLFTHLSRGNTADDVWVLPLEGNPAPTLLLGGQYGEARAKFSPDMRWIAYSSNESGRTEIYVRPFLANSPAGTPALGEGKWQISKDGGAVPHWASRGTEIIYEGSPQGTAKISVGVKTTGAAFEAGVPQKLFDGPADYGWDVTADGKKFLMSIVPAGKEAKPTPITVVLNWQAELKK